MEPSYSVKLDEALVFAADAFRRTRRKGTPTPYLTHLLAVAAMVGEGGGDEEQIIAAVLHDWLEDIPGATPAELEQRFGPRVTRLVLALSDSTGHPKPPWRDRKERYLVHLRESPHEVKLISCADKLHNCRCTVVDLRLQGPSAFERFNAGRDGTLWYYSEVVGALSHEWDHWLLEQLRREVDELHRLG